MSGLSEEQRRRMEENRRKALQKRQKSQGSSDANPSNIARTYTLPPSSDSMRSLSTSLNPSGIPRSPVSSILARSSLIPNVAKCSDTFVSNSSSAHDTSTNNYKQPSSSPYSSSTNCNFNQALSALVSQQPQFPKILEQDTGFLAPYSRIPSGQPGVGMSNPIKDEARRIEENRRRALERRAAASKNSPTESAFSAVTRNLNNESTFSTNAKLVPNFYSTGQVKPSSDNLRASSSLSSKASSMSGMTYKSTGQAGVPKSIAGHNVLDSLGESSYTSKTQNVPFFGKNVRGTFRLVSKERFLVDAGFHKEMVELFKTMETKLYDALTQKWSFSVSEHDKLMSALTSLRPAVCISPVPSFVRKVLLSTARQVPSSCIDLFGLDSKLMDALMPFQHDGVCFGVSRGGRVLFADDMGLGKTIQALGVAAHYRTEWPVLVVSPSSVRYAWAVAVEQWMETVERHEVLVVTSSKDDITDAAIVIMSYDVLTRRAKEVLNHGFQVVIMDESHMIKSFKTARYKAAAPIMKRAKRLMLLSGTPALSRPSELYTQISAIDPMIFPSFQEYGVRYCGGKQTSWGWDFSGSSNMQELQILLEAKFMIRRLKSQVLDQLPAKQRMTITLDPTIVESSTKAMEEVASRLGMHTFKGKDRHSALIQFYAQTAHAKLKAVGEYIKELLESDKKFLVFAHHQIMLDKLSTVCEKAKTRYVRIDGRTSGELRQNLVIKFQTNNDVKVAILSITAASTGITLTAANLVVFAELFWNPGILVQAEDRAHRIGQEDCVVIQYLVAKGTADDYIWPLVQEKLNVLSKAGLTKDNFSGSTSTHQKPIEQNTITQYFKEMEDQEDPSDVTTTTKRQKI